MPTLTIQAGNDQSVALAGSEVPGGQARFAPLVVRLTDDGGAPLAGTRVGFAGPQTGGIAVQLGPDADTIFLSTDANGVATADQMAGNSAVCYYGTGTVAVTATADNADPVSFSLTIEPAAPPPPVAGAQLAITAGQGQTAALENRMQGPRTADFAPMTVRLTGPDGAPLADQTVTWTSVKGAMAVDVDPYVGSPATTVTDADGDTTLDLMEGSSVSCYYAAGPFTVTASYGDASVVFNGTVTGTP